MNTKKYSISDVSVNLFTLMITGKLLGVKTFTLSSNTGELSIIATSPIKTDAITVLAINSTVQELVEKPGKKELGGYTLSLEPYKVVV